jgi:ABC-2 type transport system permease protein
MIICTFFFLIGQFLGPVSGWVSQVAGTLSAVTHLESLSRGVWDLRDFLYFLSLIIFFLYLTIQRLTTRRF